MSEDKVFPLPLEGRYIGNGQLKLTKPFKYVNGLVIVGVPIGFVTDAASIPPPVQPIVGSPWYGNYVEPSVIHDWLYFSKKTSRREADKIFVEGMKVKGVSWWKRRLMYRAVRIAGGIFW